MSESVAALEIYPKIVPDIYHGEPIVLSYRYDGLIHEMARDLGKFNITGHLQVQGEQNTIQLPLPLQSINDSSMN